MLKGWSRDPHTAQIQNPERPLSGAPPTTTSPGIVDGAHPAHV